MSRVADAEWQRSCESIRRFSPTIGPLGEWRALCEGGWSGSVPQGLPDLDASGVRQPSSMPQGVRSIEEDIQQMPSPAQEQTTERTPGFRESTEQLLLPPVGYSTSSIAQHSWNDPPLRNSNLPASSSLAIPRQNPYSANSEGHSDSAQTGLEPPRLPFVDPNTGSVRSLSAFPTPPTYLPSPSARQQPQHPSISQSAHSSNPNLNLPPQDSLVSTNDDRPGSSDLKDSDQIEHQQHPRDNPGYLPLSPERTPDQSRIQGRESDSIFPATTSQNESRQPTATQPQMTMPTDIRQRRLENHPLHDTKHESFSSGDTRPSNTRPHSQDDYQDNGREFGMDYNGERSTNPRTSDNSKSRPSLEREETGSRVAAMRNRFSIAVRHFYFFYCYKQLFKLLILQSGSTSPPPRDLPRLPLSVNSLASRYQSADAPLSLKPKPTSPSRQQSVPPVDIPLRQSQEPLYQDHLSTSPASRSVLSNSEDDHRQQRSDELDYSERRRREQQLIEKRERELEIRTQELERDRLWLMNMRENDEGNVRDQPLLRPRERRASLRHQLERRLSQMDLDNLTETAPLGSSSSAASPKPNPRSQYSYDPTHLIPPSLPATNTPPATIHSPPSPRYDQNSQSSPPLQKTRLETQYEQHETRSFPGNNNTSGPSSDYRQPGPLKPQDKPKSSGNWIRRLSMPVGNAFNLDSKRHQSNGSVSSTTSNFGVGSGISGPVRSGRGLFSMDARKNVSTTALRIPGEGGDHHAQEDGRLDIQRSGVIGVQGRRYEANGLKNRSMTNLAGRQ